MVPHRSAIARVGPRDQCRRQAVRPQAHHGHCRCQAGRGEGWWGRWDPDGRVCCGGGDQGREFSRPRRLDRVGAPADRRECSGDSQDGTASQHTFVHVPSLIVASEAEEIGVEHLLRDISSSALTTGSLSSRVSSQLSSLRGLGARLTEIRDYLEEVGEGRLDVNQQIVANLQDVFNLLPNLEAAVQGGMVAEPPSSSSEAGAGEGEAGARKRPFTVATNDQLLVMYLSSLIRTVIALHDLVRSVSLLSPR